MSKTLKELEQDCDWSDKFHEYCKNKMIVGRQKYGRWKDNRVDVNIWASIEARWENYQKTGNKEMLEDISNLAMMEWLLPLNPKAHRDGLDQNAPPIKKF